MNRFFINSTNIKEDTIIIDDKNDVKHITKVLRLLIGEHVMVSDTHEWEYEGEIIDVEPEVVVLKIIDKQKFAREPYTEITLFQSLPKQSKMETIVQKSVELGVNKIVPIVTERTIVKTEKLDKKIDRWQKISEEAAKQCGRGFIPQVTYEKMDFEAYDLVLLPYEDEDEKNIKEVLRNLESKPKKIAIIIGPEGGFSENEAKEFMSKGAVSVSLGKTILRTETAGPVTIAMTMYELEL